MKNQIIIWSIIISLTSCTHKDEKKYVINTFHQPIYDTITPKTNVRYTTQCIKVKGYVDDTIFVAFGNKHDSNKFYLIKEIDTVINPDYYGNTPAVFYFDPYKAKNGKLEISFSILGGY